MSRETIVRGGRVFQVPITTSRTNQNPMNENTDYFELFNVSGLMTSLFKILISNCSSSEEHLMHMDGSGHLCLGAGLWVSGECVSHIEF